MPRYTPREHGFAVFTLQMEHHGLDAPPGRHLHEDHEILLGGRGAADFLLDDGRRMTVSAGQVLVIPGGVPHQLYIEHHAQCSGVRVHPEVFSHLAASHSSPLCTALARCDGALPPLVTYHPRHYQTLLELHGHAQLEHADHDELASYSLRQLGRAAAVCLLRLLQASQQRGQRAWDDSTSIRVLQTKHWIDRHYLEISSVSMLADMSLLSTSRFTAVFHAMVGCSPHAYITQRRLDQSTELLAQTDLSIAEIAQNVGFSTQAHFCRTFKRSLGCSPSEYRKNVRRQLGEDGDTRK